MKNILKKYQLFLMGALIFLVCFLAYGKILGMYFYLEDYLILHSIQHPNSPSAGYGSGIVGRPYGYAVTPFIPFYYLFKLNPFGYYLVEIILYFLAAIAVYYLVLTLTKNKNASLGSSLIFASGYVGSESLYRLAVGWQNIFAAIFISLSAAFYYRYIKNPSLKSYILAFFIYLFTSEFSFYRAHGIVLIVLSLEILFNFKPIKSLIRMIPFALSYWYFYVYSIRDFMSPGSTSATLLHKIFAERHYNYLLVPLKTLENLFVPDKINLPLFIFLAAFLVALAWKRNKTLIYCLIFTAANFLVYFYYSPGSPQETAQRYLLVSYVGAASFWGIFLDKVFSNKLKYFLSCSVILALNLGFSHKEQINILQNRSKPSARFWQDMRSQVASLPEHSAIYIDSKNDGVSKPARDAAVGAGSMGPTTSFAAYYGIDWTDIYLAETFSELLEFIKDGQVLPKNVYTFFYSKNEGLVNTTDLTKEALAGTKSASSFKSLSDISLPYSSPLLLDFSSDVRLISSSLEYSKEKVDLPRYLQFLNSKVRYYKNVSASSTTQVRYSEIKNIIDENAETSWRADDLDWANSHKEEVILDLGETKTVGGILIIPASIARTPSKYTYECSQDRVTWDSLGSYDRKVEKVDEFLDKLKVSTCHFIKLTISATERNGPPQISEIVIIEDGFADLNVDHADKIEADPFRFVSSQEDINVLHKYLNESGASGEICINTDKQANKRTCTKHNFKLGINNDSVFIDQGGKLLQNVEIKLPSQLQIETKNPKIRYLTFKELDKLDYITKYED
ncbi:MAG: hypothetical protein A3E16_01080 [Candidatus Blackburnbacteria bacterium RIFCSPHIGHO2_12_FULL_44_25]|nr:MAG: hypothetical protein A3E16_01080 [Candidatus Blackburnbacteria bacterium RIFCSPHIGHO2_12_FULL_44_25]